MKKLLWSLLGLFGISSSVAAVDNAGVYLSRTFDDSKIEFSNIAADAKVKKDQNEEGYRLEVVWPDVTVLINRG